jgi:hypothetical protein
VQVVDEADAAVADKLLDGGDGHLLCLAVFVARAQLSANPPAMSATGAQLPAEPPATSVARGPRAPSLAAVNLSQPSPSQRQLPGSCSAVARQLPGSSKRVALCTQF